MLASEIIALSRDITNTNTSTLTDADALRWLNIAYRNRILDVLNIRVDKNATIKEVKTPLLSTVGLTMGNAGYNGEYPFPTDLLKPSRFEVSYDGVTWVKCEIYDNPLNYGSEYNDIQINADFSKESPRVDFTRNSYKIRPLKETAGDIDGGIYIEYEARQSALASSGTPNLETSVCPVLAYDIAGMEAQKHWKKYDAQWINQFREGKANAEKLFKDFYTRNLPTRKNITYSFNQRFN